MVYGSDHSGKDRGLSLGPCASPVVDQWFAGLGATAQSDSRLVLTNPDTRQAEVDLDVYGKHGRLQVPGTTGMKIPAGQHRVVSLPDMINDAGTKDGEKKAADTGDIAVRVRASSGRVAAIARDRRSDDGMPNGAAWHPSSAAPAKHQLIPAIPGGDGSRKVTITSPNRRRTDVKVRALGADGPFTPAGADAVSVGADSSKTVDVAKGLATHPGALRISSERPVTAAARAIRPAPTRKSGETGQGDIAIQTAQRPIRGFRVLPAAVMPDTTSELALGNAGDTATTVTVELFTLDGSRSSARKKLSIGAGSTIKRSMNEAGPGYLVVRSAPSAAVQGGITLKRPIPRGTSTSGANRDKGSRSRRGLASAALITPHVPATAPRVVHGFHVAQ